MRSFRTFYPANKRIQIISLMLASSLAVAKTSQISPVKKEKTNKLRKNVREWLELQFFWKYRFLLKCKVKTKIHLQWTYICNIGF